jgi:enoyl-CoA hydratase/carnithine racemase
VGTARARELAYTGRSIGAAEAVSLGLALATGSPAEVENRMAETVRGIVEGSAVAIAAMKEITAPVDPAIAAERSRELERRHSREVVGHPETLRRVREFLARRGAGAGK